MICGYPIVLDDFRLEVERSVANGLMSQQTGISILQLVYAVLELEKKVGTHNSGIDTSHDKRLQVIEAQLGISLPAFTEVLVTLASHANQKQRGIVDVPAAGATLTFARGFLKQIIDEDIWTRGYDEESVVLVDVSASLTGLAFSPARACTVEWGVTGDMPSKAQGRDEDFSETAAEDGSTTVTFAAFSTVRSYVVEIDSATATDPEDPTVTVDVVVYVEKFVDHIALWPAMADTLVVGKILGVTQ